MISTSLKAMLSWPSLLSNTRLTEAIPRRERLSLPEKITSTVFRERSKPKLCSPRHQRTASAMLLLPQPLGPTIAVMPWSKTSSAGWAKVLKPLICTRLTLNIDWGAEMCAGQLLCMRKRILQFGCRRENAAATRQTDGRISSRERLRIGTSGSIGQCRRPSHSTHRRRRTVSEGVQDVLGSITP